MTSWLFEILNEKQYEIPTTALKIRNVKKFSLENKKEQQTTQHEPHLKSCHEKKSSEVGNYPLLNSEEFLVAAAATYNTQHTT